MSDPSVSSSLAPPRLHHDLGHPHQPQQQHHHHPALFLQGSLRPLIPHFQSLPSPLFSASSAIPSPSFSILPTHATPFPPPLTSSPATTTASTPSSASAPLPSFPGSQHPMSLSSSASLIFSPATASNSTTASTNTPPAATAVSGPLPTSFHLQVTGISETGAKSRVETQVKLWLKLVPTNPGNANQVKPPLPSLLPPHPSPTSPPSHPIPLPFWQGCS